MGLFIASFISPVAMILAISGAFIILNMLLFIFETRITSADEKIQLNRHCSPSICLGLVLYIIVFAFIFSSQAAPVVRSAVLKAIGLVGPASLVIVVGSFFAAFELGHLLVHPAGAPERLLAYLLWIQGAGAALSGAAIVAVAAATLAGLTGETQTRQRRITRAFSGAVLSIVIALVVHRLIPFVL